MDDVIEIARFAALKSEKGGHGIDQSKLSLPWWTEQIILACMHARMPRSIVVVEWRCTREYGVSEFSDD